MNTDYYRDKLVMSDHLNSNAYEKVEINSDTEIISKLKELVDKHSSCLTVNEKNYLKDYEWKSSELYVLPKIHKCKSILDAIPNNKEDVLHLIDPPDLKGRPIVAGCNTPTRHLSELIEKILKPRVETQKTFIKDDWDYLKQLPSHVDGAFNLFSCDVTSLYTSITHELGIEAINYWLNKRRDLIKTRFNNAFIIESLEFILKNNNFLFNNIMYNQRVGTAMGHIFAPPYACLVIGYLEEDKLFKDELYRHFEEHDIQIIQSQYKRYMDDGSTLLPKTIKHDKFLSCLNNLHPDTVFTIEPATNTIIDCKPVQKVNFLDITIILYENGKIETDIHYKPTNSHKYLNYNSFHPTHCKDNIPFNLAKRIIVFVTNSDKMELRLRELEAWLIECNYPRSIINKGIHNARLQGPVPKPTNKKNKIPFVTTYMSNLDIKPIMNSIRTLVANKKSAQLQDVLNEVKIVVAYKQPKI